MAPPIEATESESPPTFTAHFRFARSEYLLNGRRNRGRFPRGSGLLAFVSVPMATVNASASDRPSTVADTAPATAAAAQTAIGPP
jgi:hypothetical protein